MKIKSGGSVVPTPTDPAPLGAKAMRPSRSAPRYPAGTLCLAVMVAAGGLSACGQKGPLTLPSAPTPASSSSSPAR